MTASQPLPRAGIYRILVCRPNHRLGNTLLLTPLIDELRQLYPGAEVDIVSEGDIAHDVFEDWFNVRQVFCLPRRGFKHPIAFLRTLGKIRRTRYDMIVDPVLRSGFSRTLTRLVPARYKLGFSDVPTNVLTHAAPTAIAGAHMAQRPVNLVRWAAGVDTSRAHPPLRLFLSGAEKAEGRRVVDALIPPANGDEPGLRIGIFGNATGSKRYGAPWWAEFMGTLGPALPTARTLELIPAHGTSMLGTRWPGYYSSDIRRMAAVLAALDVFITADCGVMHLAVAAGVPTIGLFRATVLDVYIPYGHGNTGIHTGDANGRDTARRVLDWIALLQRVAPETSAPRPVRGGVMASPQRAEIARAMLM
ncbi:glycosyltransferase family 9 protein [Luteibacter sahnii]|uniref:glycosyltransferase family 9 protein n=1 Tax=Luteibacter sahnii TaxID=3021977 RepID=UPI002A69ECF5|nr:glycosyltransferase family 9 protein [Luteibacter sp. PPL193]MDY1549811.1 glycosyltransferase family 9 protein [Luteibacter sp. PPL193]